MKKISRVLIITLLLLLVSSVAVLADTPALNFSLTVPASLPINVDADGNVGVSSDIHLKNDSYATAIITSVKISPKNSWSIVDYNTTDFAKKPVDLKEFALSLNGDNVLPDGTLTMTPANWGSIPTGETLLINYNAKVSAQSDALNNASIANVIFTVGWVPNNYMVSYVSNGGSAVNQATVAYGSLVTKPTDPTREGWTFKGWHTDSALTVPWNFGTDIMPHQDITLYAKWTDETKPTKPEVNYGLYSGVWTNQSITITASSTDAGSGIDRYQWSTNGGLAWTDFSTGTQNTFSTDGNVTVIVRTLDKAGNASDVSDSLVIKIDKEAPTVTFAPNGNATASNSQSTTVTVTDTSGLNTLQYQWTNSTTYPTVGTWTTFTSGSVITKNTEQGNFYLHIKAIDKAGNEAKITSSAFNLVQNKTVTFNSNGGNAPSPASKVVTYNTAVGDLPTPTRTGYTLQGWAITSGATTPNFTVSSIVTADITVYAVWKINQYTLTMNSNGGSAVANIVQNYGTAVTAPANPTRAGYTFAGWSPAIPSTMPATNQTHIAQWTVNSYDFNFNSNGGTAVTKQTVAYGSKATAPTAPTKAGYTFAGWYKEAALTNAWNFTTDTMPANAVTVYAKWTVDAYTITYNLDGGTHSGNPTGYNVETATITLTNASKTGYTFTGWYDAATGGNKVTSIAKGSTGNKTLWARFTINQYTLTFNSNGGSAVASKTQNYGTAVTAPANPTRAGYTFAGWSPAIPSTMPAANQTHVAQWTPLSYTVTFNANGGTTPSPASKSVTYDGTYGTLATTSRVGYTFAGWYTATTGGTKIDTTTKVSIVANQTLYARWTPVNYTITYNLDGGSHSGNPTTYNIETNTITLANASKTGYTFTGWYDAATGGNKVTSIAKGSTGNKALYARFVDETAPTPPTIAKNPNVEWTNQNTTVTITAGTDTGSGVDRTEYKINSGTWTTYSTAISVSTVGTTTISARTIDKAGNISTEVSTVVKIDKTAPTVTFGKNGNSTPAMSHSTTVTVSDTGSGVSTRQYVWSTSPTTPSSGWTTFTNGATLSQSSGDGDYYLHIKATDTAGNTVNARSNIFKLTQAYLATDSDFQYVTSSSAPNIYEGGQKGYYNYIGTAEYVAIPHTIKGNIITDYYKMFDNSSVKGVASNNPNVTNMSYMFNNSQATTLDLSSFDTSNVTNMSYMFYKSKATTLDLSSFNTSNVTGMFGMFWGSQATTLDLSNFNTSNVTGMGSMFRNSKATTLDLSSFNTSKVTNMSYMFYDSQATTLDLSSFDTSKVTDMIYMFYNSSATTLDLSSFNTSNVTNMSYMFQYSKATTLDLSSFDTSKVTIMVYMFHSSQATTLDLSNFNTSNVTGMSNMFNNSQATTLDLSSFNTSNVTGMSSMFNNSQATTLDLSSFDTSNVIYMTSMFQNSKVTTLDLSRFNTSNVTYMLSMFQGSKVTTLDLSSFDTANVTNMNSMFRDSAATEGYARTQADADKFNASSGKPAGLIFNIVSPTSLRMLAMTLNPLDETYVWVTDPEGYYSTTNDDVGYYRYEGTDTEVTIPEEVNGEVLTSYYKMFSDTYVNEVTSTSQHITDITKMFSYAYSDNLKITLNTENIQKADSVFEDANIEVLDLTDLILSADTDVLNIFRGSIIGKLLINTELHDFLHTLGALELLRGDTVATDIVDPSQDPVTRDFEWIVDPDGYYSTYHDSVGYYHYRGQDNQVVIPYEINGEVLTSYYKMFANTSFIGDLVIVSTSNEITKIDKMLDNVYADSVNLRITLPMESTPLQVMARSSFDIVDMTNTEIYVGQDYTQLFEGVQIKTLLLRNLEDYYTLLQYGADFGTVAEILFKDGSVIESGEGGEGEVPVIPETPDVPKPDEETPEVPNPDEETPEDSTSTPEITEGANSDGGESEEELPSESDNGDEILDESTTTESELVTGSKGE